MASIPTFRSTLSNNEQVDCLLSIPSPETEKSIFYFSSNSIKVLSINDIISQIKDSNELNSLLMNYVNGAFPGMVQSLISQVNLDSKLNLLKNTIITSMNNLFQSKLFFFSPQGVIISDKQTYKEYSKMIEFLFSQMGWKIAYQLASPLKFSGRDYVPISARLCLVGVGVGSEEAAVRQLMKKDAFQTERVAVVRDFFDRSREHLFLEDILHVIDSKTVLIRGSILGKENVNRRLVNEYVRVSPKKFELVRMDVELRDYLQSLGIDVLPIPDKVEGVPVFNLGLGNLLISNEHLASILSNANPNLRISLVDSSTLLFLQHSLILRRPDENVFQTLPPLPNPLPRAWDSFRGSSPRQTTEFVLIVPPFGFSLNAETAADNYFMNKTSMSPMEIEARALKEYSHFLIALVMAGVKPVLFSGERFYQTPDAVYPNNWFSTHTQYELGQNEPTLVLYPMKTPTRRAERRKETIDELCKVYTRVISLTDWENSDVDHYLESTGALVLDRVHKVAYATLSQRCSKKVVREWAKRFGYELVLFHAKDSNGMPIYHTNVVMSIGTSVAVVCLQCVSNQQEVEAIVSRLKHDGYIFVEITLAQMFNFCGNILELRGDNGKRVLAMSSRAYKHFTQTQLDVLSQHVDQILHTPIETIETIGGGGIRCMLGEIF